MNEAAVPCPSEKGVALPLPASVVVLHSQGGSAPTGVAEGAPALGVVEGVPVPVRVGVEEVEGGSIAEGVPVDVRVEELLGKPAEVAEGVLEFVEPGGAGVLVRVGERVREGELLGVEEPPLERERVGVLVGEPPLERVAEGVHVGESVREGELLGEPPRVGEGVHVGEGPPVRVRVGEGVWVREGDWVWAHPERMRVAASSSLRICLRYRTNL